MFSANWAAKGLLILVLLAFVSFTFDHGQAWASQATSESGNMFYSLPATSDGESNLPYLYAVFTIVWAAFFGFVFLMSKRQRDLRKELEALKKIFEEKAKDKSSPDKK